MIFQDKLLKQKNIVKIECQRIDPRFIRELFALGKSCQFTHYTPSIIKNWNIHDLFSPFK